MDLPKIPNNQLPKEIREIVGNGDAHFDAIVEPSEVMIPEFDLDSFNQGKYEVQQMLIESRKKLNEYRTKERHANQRHDQGSKENN